MANIYRFGLAYNGVSHDDYIVGENQSVFATGIDTRSTKDIRLSKSFEQILNFGPATSLESVRAMKAVKQ